MDKETFNFIVSQQAIWLEQFYKYKVLKREIKNKNMREKMAIIRMNKKNLQKV